MNRLSAILFLGILFALTLSPAFGELHEFYAQNGDCYVLIGDGQYRGVYALNNLTGGGIQKLYNRADLDAYGLAAGQQWDSVAEKTLKYLYTFAGADTGWSAFSGILERKVVVTPDNGIYGPDTVPPYIVHRFHGSPANSPTGRGNHPQSILNSKFGGFDYPCSVMPTAVPGRAGYYYVETGRFYHAMDWPVWSPYTYQCPFDVNLSRRPDGTFVSACTTRMAGPDPITREWARCGCQARSARGGWVHWVLRENVEVKYRDLKLYEYNRTNLSGPIIKENLPRIKIQERSTMDKRGECVDGCISAADGVEMPSKPSPYLDTAYSSGLARSYLYTRDPGSTIYTLTGRSGTDQIAGNPGDLSAKSLGVSSKDETGNFVYVLGINEINRWLREINSPADMYFNELTDIAVSDQWWQTGGIVYAYDRTKGKVTKFTRLERTGTTRDTEEILVADGSALPDSIGVDGFGHLYMIKTYYDPLATSTFAAGNVKRTEPVTGGPGGAATLYRAFWEQKVSKSVFKRDYYSGIIAKEPGDIVIGYNQFYRDFNADDLSDTSTWRWVDNLYQIGGNINTQYRTELAVINGATPPEISSTTAVVDCRGPLKDDGTGNLIPATPDADGFHERDTEYYFEVENAPIFDANGVNIGSRGVDKDGDNRTGCFPSTTKDGSIRYFWKVVQYKDGTGADVSNIIMDQEYSSSLLLTMLPEGEYRVGVKALFKFYEYNRLKPGDLATKKETVLSAEKVGIGEDAAGYSWVTFKVKWVAPDPDIDAPGIVMGGKWNGSNHVYRPQVAQDPLIEKVPSNNFVLAENETMWSFQLRDSRYQTQVRGVDRIERLFDRDPPDPGDISMETGSLNWLDDKPKFVWESYLYRDADQLLFRSVTKLGSASIYIADIKGLFPLPSQPASYSLRVTGTRTYEYWVQVPRITYVGGRPYTIRERVRKTKTLKLEGWSNIYITDETGPMLTFTDPLLGGRFPGFFLKDDLLYGTTGESLAQTELPPAGNPPTLEFIVVDNNPFANVAGSNVTDPYFSLSTHHNLNHRIATFAYSTAQHNTIPTSYPGETAMQRLYSTYPGTGKVTGQDLTEAQFKASWVPSAATVYNKCFSYRLYRISRDELKHFSQTTPGVWSENMDPSWANSANGYANLTYGLGWGESSGFQISPQLAGQILIRDNDRPNAFLKAVDAKFTEAFYYAPSNVLLTAMNPWTRLALAGDSETINNGINNWNTLNIAGINSSFRITAGQPFRNRLASGTIESQFETDIPVLFTPLLTDNIATPTINTFGIRFEDGSDLADVDDRTDGKPIRCVFRKAATYTVILSIQDFARGWPADKATALTNPRNAPLRPNTRILNVNFPIYKTRLDVRVLDKNNRAN